MAMSFTYGCLNLFLVLNKNKQYLKCYMFHLIGGRVPTGRFIYTFNFKRKYWLLIYQALGLNTLDQ